MDDGEKIIFEIRKGLVEQLVLATGQFVGDIDRILLTFGFKDESIANSSPGMFAYFTARMALIEAIEDFPNVEFFYVDEYTKAIAKAWASTPEMAPEVEKDLEIATQLFNKVIENSISIGNFKGRESLYEIPMNLSKEFIAILFNKPIRDEKLKNALTYAVSDFQRERLAQLKVLFKEMVTKIENAIQEKGQMSN